MSNYEKIKDFSRFTNYGTSGLLSDSMEYEIYGKQLTDLIIEIEKMGQRLTPKLRKLLNQANRLTKSEDSSVMDKLNPAQKKNFKFIVGFIQMIYSMYNSVIMSIEDFKRKAVSKKDAGESLTKKEGGN